MVNGKLIGFNEELAAKTINNLSINYLLILRASTNKAHFVLDIPAQLLENSQGKMHSICLLSILIADLGPNLVFHRKLKRLHLNDFICHVTI